MELWYPPADRSRRAPFDGEWIYPNSAWKGLLHTTEGRSFAGAWSAYASRGGYPHFTVSFEAGRFQCWQHVPLDRSATTLQNHPLWKVNRDRVIQIEIVETAASEFSEPIAYLEGIRQLMIWIERQTGIKPVSSVQWKDYPASYGINNGIRLGLDAWIRYNGWLGHQHAPGNDHGDPGLMNITYLLLRESQGVVMEIEGELHIVVRGTTGSVWHKWFDAGWHGWEDLGGWAKENHAPAITRTPNGYVVTVVGAEEHTFIKQFVRGKGWSPWEDIGGEATSGPGIAA
jgi:hypothetical protein